MTEFRTNIEIKNRSNENISVWFNIIKEWQKININYLKKNSFTDSLYWYNERANIGCLAGAIWKIGGFALEEYGATKGEDSKYGRIDLYFSVNEIELVIESKQIWLKFTKEKNEFKVFESYINKALDNATNDCKKSIYNSKHNGFGLVFITPYWKKGLDKNKKLKRFEEELLQKNYDIIGVLSIDVKNEKDEYNLISASNNTCNAAYIIGKYIHKN